MAFKMKGSSFYGKGNQSKSPAKHSTNRKDHNRRYDTFENVGEDDEKRTKKHTNADHPDYWKVKEHTTRTTDKNPDYDETKKKYYHRDYNQYSDSPGDGKTENPNYDETKSNYRINKEETKYYASDKDKEIQETRHKKKGGGYMGDVVYTEYDDVGHTSTNTKDRVGKTDGNTYKTKRKSSSSSSSKSSKSSKKKVSYEASYTDAVADKWKDKGGKEAYIKAAKAYNAKKRK
jgi:hypothetical protein